MMTMKLFFIEYYTISVKIKICVKNGLYAFKLHQCIYFTKEDKNT